MSFKKYNKLGRGSGVSSDNKQELENEHDFELESVEKRKRRSCDGDINMTMPKKKKSKPTIIHKRKTFESNLEQEIKTTKHRQNIDDVPWKSLLESLESKKSLFQHQEKRLFPHPESL